MIGGEGGIPQSFFLSLFAIIRQTNLQSHNPSLSGQTKFILLSCSHSYSPCLSVSKSLPLIVSSSHYSLLIIHPQ